VKTFFIVFFGFILILFLIGLLRVRVNASLGEKGIKIRLKILSFNITVYSSKKEQKMKTKNKKNNATTAKEHGAELPKVRDLIKLAKEIFSKLRNKLTVDILKIDIQPASDDPFKTAMMFGGIGAGVGILISALENLFVVKRKEIFVIADFSSNLTRMYIEVQLSLRIIQILFIALFVVMELSRLSKLPKTNIITNNE